MNSLGFRIRKIFEFLVLFLRNPIFCIFFLNSIFPGYAGFIPHSAAKSGKSFTTLTRRALEEFKDPSTEARHEREAAAESFKARLANISVDIYNGSQTVSLLIF